MGIIRNIGAGTGIAVGVSTLAASIAPIAISLPAMAPVANVGILTTAFSGLGTWGTAIAGSLTGLGTSIASAAPWLVSIGTPIVATFSALAVSAPLLTIGAIVAISAGAIWGFKKIGAIVEDKIEANKPQLSQRMQSVREAMAPGKSRPSPQGTAPTQQHTSSQSHVPAPAPTAPAPDDNPYNFENLENHPHDQALKNGTSYTENYKNSQQAGRNR